MTKDHRRQERRKDPKAESADSRSVAEAAHPAAASGRDWSKTLFLPQTDFPMRAGLPDLEPKLLKRWDEIGPLREAACASEGHARSSCCTTARPTPTATSTSATR